MVISFIVGILLLAFGGVFIYVRNELLPSYLEEESDCLDFDAFKTAEEGLQKSMDVICTIYCPCKMDNEIYVKVFPKLNPDQTQVTYGTDNVVDCNACDGVSTLPATDQADVYTWIFDNLGIDVAAEGECTVGTDTYKDEYLSDYKQYLPLIKWTENYFDCSGLCISRPIYLFSDINDGVPGGSCREQLYDWAREQFLTLGAIGVAVGIYQLLVFMMAAGLCCNCTKSRHEKKDSKQA